MRPVGIDDLKESCAFPQHNNNDINSTIFNKQIIDLLDQHIPAPYRTNYLKLKYGEKISKIEMAKLIAVIQDILSEHNYEY